MAIEIVKLQPKIKESVVDFFSKIDNEKFHPHDFSEKVALDLCDYDGEDCYYVVIDNNIVLAYGILRGWDAGHDIPSLGIYVGSNCRGLGMGKMLMNFLHCAAKAKGAKKVRLKVYKNNIVAIHLYKKIGYVIEDYDDEQLLGIFNL